MRKPWRWVLVLVVLALVLSFWLGQAGPRVQPGSWLVIDLAGEYVDAPQASPLLARLLGQRQRSLLATLSMLTKAERDERLGAVLLRIGALDVGWGKAEELRAAVARLRESGRRTIAYLEVEKLGGNLEYYIASAADEVVMAPAARSAMVGLAGEYLFLGGLFEKIGIDIQYERIGRYKTAVESYAERKMSEPNREMTESLLDSLEAQFLATVADARGLTPTQVEEAVDAGPSTPEAYEELGLVDRVAFYDEILAGVGDPPVVETDTWAQVSPESVGFEPQATFALVYGTGPVVTGEGSFGPGGQFVLAAETVAQAIVDAAEDPEIRAIVFRVDSPGGSPLASDVVWRAVQRARQMGKPVVASFSDVAASGGYYVACGADRIVSLPATFTGSIGVFVLRPVLGELFAKLGIGVETITRGARAELLLTSQPLTPAAREVLEREVESIYALFVRRVAEGRDMSPEAVDAVGRGRVWTGAQAVEIGLVDALGGIRTASAEAKELLGMDRDADVVLVPYPPPKPLLQQLFEMLGGVAVDTLVDPLPRSARRVVELVRALPPGAPLLVPPALVEIR